jgi:hypothetical protein
VADFFHISAGKKQIKRRNKHGTNTGHREMTPIIDHKEVFQPLPISISFSVSRPWTRSNVNVLIAFLLSFCLTAWQILIVTYVGVEVLKLTIKLQFLIGLYKLLKICTNKYCFMHKKLQSTLDNDICTHI